MKGTLVKNFGTDPDRYVYYPSTEALAKDEICLVALGTGANANMAAFV